MKFNKTLLLITLTISVISLTACGNKAGQNLGSSTESESLSESTESTESTETTEIVEEVIDLHPYDFTLCFAGDIS